MGSFNALTHFSSDAWWLWLPPPAWFAGFDDALAGDGRPASWGLAAVGLVVTALVLWLAFGKLAHAYVSGLQALGETAAPRRARRTRGRWLGRLIAAPPLCWWLRDSVSRASFQLTLAYLVRDRDVKLRLYPGLAPFLVFPLLMLFQARLHFTPDQPVQARFAGYGLAFSGAYLGLIPMLALGILQYSQHWQAADLFRAVPLSGPARLFHGTRQAVLLFLVLPMLILFAVAARLLGADWSSLALLLPGILLLPLYALVPGLRGGVVPLSQPIESAKAAGRGLTMLVSMFLSIAVGGVATLAWGFGWFAWFLAAEVVVAAVLYVILRRHLNAVPWSSME
jgi:hypothetical protein